MSTQQALIYCGETTINGNRAGEVNITEYPVTSTIPSSKTLTFGDIHGNSMKLIWLLLRNGVIAMSKDDFKRLWEIYRKSGLDDLQKDERSDATGNTRDKQKITEIINQKQFDIKDIQEFSNILSRTQVTRGCQIRLIGDVFADRGNNDWLTLKVLEKLNLGGDSTEILASNHDAMFLATYEDDVDDNKNLWMVNYGTNYHQPANMQHSKFALLAMVKKGLISHDELKRQVESYVLPSMKLISYTLSEDKAKITLFMHAPNSVEIIKGIANELGVTYKDSSAQELATTIDNINVSFAVMKFHDKEKYKEIIKAMTFSDSLDTDYTDFQKLVWNMARDIDPKVKQQQPPSCIANIIHGHTGQGPNQNGEDDNNYKIEFIKNYYYTNLDYINLDTDLGKGKNPEKPDKDEYKYNKGTYVVYSTNEGEWQKNDLLKLPLEHHAKHLLKLSTDQRRPLFNTTEIEEQKHLNKLSKKVHRDASSLRRSALFVSIITFGLALLNKTVKNSFKLANELETLHREIDNSQKSISSASGTVNKDKSTNHIREELGATAPNSKTSQLQTREKAKPDISASNAKITPLQPRGKDNHGGTSPLLPKAAKSRNKITEKNNHSGNSYTSKTPSRGA
jgi:hypothetical protein